MQLRAKKILITGGSSGIGKACAKMLCENGAQVIITGRDKVKLDAVAKEIGAVAISGDIAEPNHLEDVFKWITQNWNDSLDVLINNAGIGDQWNEIDELDWNELKNVFAVNVYGCALATSLAAKRFKRQRSGQVISIGSIAGVNAVKGRTIYSGSKFALKGMSKVWEQELKAYGVQVTCLHPGEVKTAFNDPERIEREEKETVLRPIDIAETVLFLIQMDTRGHVSEMVITNVN